MLKKKNIKRRIQKPKAPEKVENKFEQKINKQKHYVLGQKFVKGIKGQPTHSKSMSIKKRMESLLIEYQSYGKDNLFNDKRIGEKDQNLTVDEKNLKRFKIARKSQAQLYNLGDGDEEELTHAGKKLSQIENFEEPLISDDEEDDGKISVEMQKEHFGGGKFEGESRTKSHADKMAELVLKSIISKNARKKEKNELLNDIDEINNSMKSILPELNRHLGSNIGIEKTLKPDELDLKMKMLMFLPKGKPSDRSKTEEERIKEEKEKLEQLERERLQRMKIPDKNLSSHGHSVDDLYTNLDITLQKKDNRVKFSIDEKMKSDRSENEKSDDDNADDQSDNSNDNKNTDTDNVEKSENDVSESDNDETDGTDDNLSDVLSMSDENDHNDLAMTSPFVNNKEKMIKDKAVVNIKDLKSYDDFLSLLKQNNNNELIIIDQLQKEFIKNVIDVENNEFENLFDYILKYMINYLCNNDVGDCVLNFNLCEALVRPLYQSMLKDPVHSGIHMANMLSDFQKDYVIAKKAHNGVSYFPKVKILFYCKLVPTLMSSSDFHHHVCSPAMLYMSQLLNECRITCVKDVSFGLIISSILLEMVAVSKRFIPEVIQYLSLILFLANGKKYVKNFEEKLNLKQAKNLNVICIENDIKSLTIQLPIRILKPFDCRSDDLYLNGSDIKLDLIFFSLELISKAVDLYCSLPSFHEIFADIKILIKYLPVNFCPQRIEQSAKNIIAKFESTKILYRHLSFLNLKPKPLKLFEPKIEAKVDDRKKLHGSREFKVEQREKMKLKKLRKSSEREIRKDQRFLREHILADKIQKNKEREEKTKKIMNSLSVQEGEFKNLLKRKKLAEKSEKNFKKNKIEKI